MGLLDGKKALIFGVANDHSIAWGIAKALHDQGATLGFSSVESLIERRVRPLADFDRLDVRRGVRRVQSDEQIAGVMAKWGDGLRPDRRPRPRAGIREARGPRR